MNRTEFILKTRAQDKPAISHSVLLMLCTASPCPVVPVVFIHCCCAPHHPVLWFSVMFIHCCSALPHPVLLSPALPGAVSSVHTTTILGGNLAAPCIKTPLPSPLSALSWTFQRERFSQSAVSHSIQQTLQCDSSVTPATWCLVSELEPSWGARLCFLPDCTALK